MKIIFFGSPKFSVPFINALILAEDIEVIGVVTQPDKAIGRSQELKPSAVAETASAYSIPVLKPDNLKDEIFQEQLSKWKADAYVVIAYGKIIPNIVLDIPKLGVINVHPSLLPKYRGATPMQAAIREGDQTTGITIMKMDHKMDHGPILAQLKLEIKKDVDYPALQTKVAYKGPPLLVHTLRAFADGRLKPKEQNHEMATYIKLFDRDSGMINWKNQKATEIERMMRAYRPWPGIWTTWNGKRLKVLNARIATGNIIKNAGSVSQKNESIFVETKKGSLELIEIQLEGSKATLISDFLLGHKDFVGSVLGNETISPSLDA
ncbi:MAG: methionyl-tRNA formyltransferase [bacterium]|nr:methionyl-tRNA formyltransferase [bacterium]